MEKDLVEFRAKVAATPKPKPLAKLKSLRELCTLAKTDDRYKFLIIITLENFGCEHLAPRRNEQPKWEAYSNGIYQIQSLVGEYGIAEDEVFHDVLEEINSLRTHVDNVTERDLAWK